MGRVSIEIGLDGELGLGGSSPGIGTGWKPNCSGNEVHFVWESRELISLSCDDSIDKRSGCSATCYCARRKSFRATYEQIALVVMI
ncbi:hypothetical protein IQ255_19675 [Pleurocapsales cyanobacterium LEGE 10410]|nr:hypothetical protein [Pleurocapsales cyanobacterium LEGE 10410]